VKHGAAHCVYDRQTTRNGPASIDFSEFVRRNGIGSSRTKAQSSEAKAGATSEKGNDRLKTGFGKSHSNRVKHFANDIQSLIYMAPEQVLFRGPLFQGQRFCPR
jgi:hypothetical protein